METIIDAQLQSELEYIELYPVGDIHYGSVLCNLPKFQQFVKHILESPNRYIIGMGDFINNNLPGSVGSVFEDTMSPRQQRKQLREELKPIADRFLVMIDGNHDRRTKKHNDESPLESIAEYFNIPYREDDAFIKISFGKNQHGKKQVYTVYATHGSGGGKRPGSSLNNLEMLTLGAWAEIYICAHHHKRTAHKASYRMPDLYNMTVRTMEMLYVVTSSFQDYGGYAKQKMMRPSSLGAVPIYLSGREKYYEARV